ncbi:zinc finger protein 436-like [Vombatus ursinus]|uniref:zinc finger protein 436-like n=1 Tax=Vombatus ursinus TaxID=29139 RepID=UPI000FFCF55A|nr:zinc finger protein 436-like [Vombatus ursinus]
MAAHTMQCRPHLERPVGAFVLCPQLWEQWKHLDLAQKKHYWDIMRENYGNMISQVRAAQGSPQFGVFGTPEIRRGTLKRAETRDSHLGVHQVTHTREKLYDCAFCGKGFSWNSSLKRHQRVHAGERPYKCFCCGKGFWRSTQLAVHQRTHPGEKPYICNQCGKSFSQLSGLCGHKTSHVTQRPRLGAGVLTMPS